IVREGRPAVGASLTHRAPLPLGEIGAPQLPRASTLRAREPRVLLALGVRHPSTIEEPARGPNGAPPRQPSRSGRPSFTFGCLVPDVARDGAPSSGSGRPSNWNFRTMGRCVGSLR